MHPQIALRPGAHRRIKAGHPWVYSNEVVMDAAAKSLEPGVPVVVVGDNGERYGTALFNPHSLLAARLVDRAPDAVIDQDFLAARLARALSLRERLFCEPYYRLVHAEADGLPGLTVDRFGEAVTVQINAAAMERLKPALIGALDRVLAPETLVVRADSAVRALEGLERYVEVVRGRSADVAVRENGALYRADLEQGQKTGWFYDQRRSRAFVAALLRSGGRMLDVYCGTGGFAVLAAVAGAEQAVLVDRSAHALALAAAGARDSGIGERCRTVEGDAFETMTAMAEAGERYDVVVVDPPSFVPSKKALQKGAKAYRRASRLGAALVRPGGFLFTASCSHNMPADRFVDEVRAGLADARRTGRILRIAGAGPDHPVHPALPETAYLKSVTLAID